MDYVSNSITTRGKGREGADRRGGKRRISSDSARGTHLKMRIVLRRPEANKRFELELGCAGVASEIADGLVLFLSAFQASASRRLSGPILWILEKY